MASRSLVFAFIGGVTVSGVTGAASTRIVNIPSGTKCLDIENRNYHYNPKTIPAGTEVQLWGCNDKWNQEWDFETATGHIVNGPTKVFTPKCVGSVVGAVVGTPLRLMNCNAKDETQKWVRQGKDMFMNPNTSLCLTICKGGSCGHQYPENYAPAILEKCSDAPEQQWNVQTMEPPLNKDGLYNSHGKCLDIENKDFKYNPRTIPQDTQVQLWDCNGKWNQHWDFETATGHIVNTPTEEVTYTTKCLGFPVAPKQGIPVRLYDCASAKAGTWTMQKANQQIKERTSGLCLAISMNYIPRWPHNYARAELQPCNPADTKQKWQWWWDLVV